MANTNLGKAKENKNDEFYTQLTDIENELRHYKRHFEGKVVFLNCDDPYESNFFKYFALNFNILGLKKLISISYTGSPVASKEISLFEEEGQEFTINNKRAYKVTMTELKDVTGDGRVDLDDVREIVKHRIRYLNGDGSFDSEESLEMLKEADIVVTNPPFSRFKEYLALLVRYQKKFLIIGHMNALHYKEIFPLIKNNVIWTGYGFNLSMVYKTPYTNDLEANRKYVISKGYDPDDGYVKVPAVCWYTNLDIEKRHEWLDLYKKYSPDDYPSYYNYDGIDVGKVADIPIDYFGKMGVPDTFIDKFNPEQFEIIGMGPEVEKTLLHTVVKIGDEKFIAYMKDKEILWKVPYNVSERKIGNSLRIDRDGLPAEAPFSRIIIRRKKASNIED